MDFFCTYFFRRFEYSINNGNFYTLYFFLRKNTNLNGFSQLNLPCITRCQIININTAVDNNYRHTQFVTIARNWVVLLLKCALCWNHSTLISTLRISNTLHILHGCWDSTILRISPNYISDLTLRISLRVSEMHFGFKWTRRLRSHVSIITNANLISLKVNVSLITHYLIIMIIVTSATRWTRNPIRTYTYSVCVIIWDLYYDLFLVLFSTNLLKPDGISIHIFISYIENRFNLNPTSQYFLLLPPPKYF